MALLRCDFFAETLEMSTSVSVILPEVTAASANVPDAARRGGRHPTLYLLHGLSDDHTAWVRQTAIERYVAPLGLAVVMPAVHRSFYADEAHGMRFWTFLSEELPRLAAAFFPVSRAREDTFVAGLSMGGYGALKWALRAPDRFAAAASLSGTLDVAALQRRDPSDSEAPNRAFAGTSVEGSPVDLLWLLQRAGESEAPVPDLYVACGTEDDLLADNHAFVAAARAARVPVATHFGPGDHDWGYWDATIQDVLAWLPLGRAASGTGATR